MMMSLISSCSLRQIRPVNSACYAFEEIYLTEEENDLLKNNDLNQARRQIATHNETYIYVCGGGD